MTHNHTPTLALFYCQNTPESSEQVRQSLEAEYGLSVRLFPIPCSGRLEPLHLMKALEEFADLAYVIACPEGACRYFEGNIRATKRVKRTQSILANIGLEEERIGIIIRSMDKKKSLEALTKEIIERTSSLPLSPVLGRRAKEKGMENKVERVTN